MTIPQKQREIKLESKTKFNYNSPRIMDQNLWINLQFVGLSLNYTCLTPTPYPTNNVRRVYPGFFRVSTLYRIWDPVPGLPFLSQD